MQLVCRQIVLHTVADDDVSDLESIRAIMLYFRKNRNDLSVTIKKDGNTGRHHNVRLLRVNDNNSVDFIASDITHSLTMKQVPFSSFVAISATIKEAISPEELEGLRIEEIFDFDSEGEIEETTEADVE